ncbi:MAG: Ubiquinone/menaquinone biosynthesis C-methyltransferase UbiE [Methanomassiliicoccales archaeon PtaU1.Bin124]|nr:MAG: Ubiquinone/menaquinone biosynthesis C-methyltransferase UbiE [Methanomassiliicoccales archaeon PtaU1.Bin124]
MSEHKAPRGEKLHFPHQTVDMRGISFPEGLVLDIGGGGEGIIGQLGGWRVVSIDLSKEELSEVHNDALKIVMDAKDLKFVNSSFNSVASFFSLMSIPPELHGAVFREVARVLKPEGRFLIWDMTFEKAKTEGGWKSMTFPLTVVMPSRTVETHYECWSHDQELKDFEALATKVGLKEIRQAKMGDTFFLEFSK